MEIDRDTLIKLMEVFVDTSQVLQRELLLYQKLFTAACQIKGLNEIEIKGAVDRARTVKAQEIKDACQESYQDLRAKIPQIVDILVSNQDMALKLLKEWTPKGTPN